MAELTEIEFWEHYWQDCPLPSEPDMTLPFDRCLARELKKSLDLSGGDVLEIGCAPGKWLAFFAKTFGMCASGIEYSAAGMHAVLRNFELLGLSADTIITGDFFELLPSRQFDVVMSFGFIEHFDDPDDVVARHLAWLKPGGTLVLCVPNFRGIYTPLQRALDPGILEKHNLSIMRPDYFKALAEKFSLTPLHIRYIGSFEPSLPVQQRGYRTIGQLLTKCVLRLVVPLRRPAIWDSLNHPYISSNLLAIYRK
jgi:SAM-dependent methyltransferase